MTNKEEKMATTTENLGLILPEDQEYFELDTWTGNCRKLDAGYGTTLQTIANDVAAAMHQYAEEGGTIHDIDTGFVTTLKEINHGLPFRVWLGTTEEYQTLAEAGLLEAGVLYLRSDDTSAEEIRAAVAALQAAAAELQAKTADTGWKTLSIIYDPTEWTVGTPAPKYRKIGNHVYVKGQVRINLDQMYDPDTGSEDITTIFATLPEGYRPATSFYKLIPNQGDRMARLYVRSASASGDPGGMNINYLKDYSGTPIKSGTVWIQIDCDFLTD